VPSGTDSYPLSGQQSRDVEEIGEFRADVGKGVVEGCAV
jgi:hypothetical protein